MKERTSNGEKALNASAGKRYRALVIGAGGQGALADAPGSGNESKIISYGHALSEHPGFEVVGFVDKDIYRAERAAKAWGGKAFEFIYPNFCYNERVNVIIIVTPDDTHHEILKQMAEQNPKMVICEKPICTTIPEAREIVALYEFKGIKLLVDYTRRFLPAWRKIKDACRSGEWGKFQYAKVEFNKGWEHTGSHGVDLFRWFFETDHFPPNIEIKHMPENGIRHWLAEIRYQHNYFREERYGENDVFDDIWVFDQEPYYNNPIWHVLNNAYNALLGNEPLFCTGEDALRTLEICFKLMEGAR